MISNEQLRLIAAAVSRDILPSDRKALRAYHFLSPSDINVLSSVDRTGERLPWWRSMQIFRAAHHRDVISSLEGILRRMPTLKSIQGAPDSVELYRGVGHGNALRRRRKLTLDAVIREFPVGSTFNNGQEHRFHSWTPEAGIARAFTWSSPLSLRRGFILRLRDHRVANYMGGFNKLFRERDFLMPPATADLVVTGHSIESLNRTRWPLFGQTAAVVIDVEWSNPDKPFQGDSVD